MKDMKGLITLLDDKFKKIESLQAFRNPNQQFTIHYKIKIVPACMQKLKSTKQENLEDIGNVTQEKETELVENDNKTEVHKKLLKMILVIID